MDKDVSTASRVRQTLGLTASLIVIVCFLGAIAWTGYRYSMYRDRMKLYEKRLQEEQDKDALCKIRPVPPSDCYYRQPMMERPVFSLL
jgi:hypothetical protein